MNNNWKKSALMVIDVQLGLFIRKTPIYNAETLFTNINSLIDSARVANIPIVFIQHSNDNSLVKGTKEHQYHPEIHIKTDDLIFHKTKLSAFIETHLHSFLQSKNITTLIIIGTLSNVCVRANCRAAKKLGYKVFLVEDGHSCLGAGKKGKSKVEEINKQLSTENTVELIATADVNF